MTIDTKKLRELALNGNGTASPYVPLLCSELSALLDEIDELDEECRLCADIAAEYGCLPADAPHDAVRSLGNKVEDLQDEVRELRQATSHTGAAYLVDAAVSVQRERDELRAQLAAMTRARDEACELAMNPHIGVGAERENRIRELRRVGQ